MLLFHVVISLAGILTGLVVAFGLLTNQRLEGWTAAFLLTNILTSATGFPLPAQGFMPSHAFAIICLVCLSVACVARYGKGLAGAWRGRYVSSALFALYLNCFVLIVQVFNKTPILKAWENKPPFGAAQLVLLVAFILLGRAARRNFTN